MFQTSLLQNVPVELTSLDNWLVFRYEGEPNSKGKRNKTPYQARRTHLKAKTNDPQTWSDFESAKEALATGHADGIGINIKGQLLLGVDLDHCLFHGKPNDLAKEWINAALGKTYVETTVSGEGIRIWYKCTQEDVDRLSQFKNTDRIEIYAAKSRYFTVTGNIFEGSLKQIGEMPATIWPLVERSLEKIVARHEPILSTITPDETIELAKAALEHLDPDMLYEEWIRVGLALHHASQGNDSGLSIWDEWSSQGGDYPGTDELRKKWKGFGNEGTNLITVGTLFHMAKHEGWQFPIALGLSKPSGRTENANAQRFVNKYEQNIRFARDSGKWFSWNGERWVVGETGVIALMREYSTELWRGLSTELQKAEDKRPLISFVQASNNHKQIRNAVSLAASDNRIHALSSDFDSHNHLLNCQNGILDFEKGQLLPHDTKHLCSMMANVSYDAVAKCPQWEQTVKMVACNDEELIRYLRMLFGYSCVGGNPAAVLPILLGSGRNGKSTLWLTIRGILGDYAGMISASALTGQFEQHPTWIHNLRSKRFVVVEESEENSQLREAVIKRITGSDVMQGRAMRQDFVEFEPTHTAWMPTNCQPRVTGVDNGIWRRLKLVPFNADISKISDGVKNEFHRTLIEEESSGILNWLLAGYRDWKSNGFIEPQCVRTATEEYRQSEDTHRDKFEGWLAENCNSSPDAITPLESLWESFQLTGSSMDRRSLSKRLGMMYEPCKITRGPKKGNTGYRGVELKSLVEALPF